MPSLVERQKGFARALLNAEVALPSGLTASAAAPSLKRFNVYRNNVMVSLIDALKAAYPATLRLVGEDFFCAMAQVFASAHPPQSPLMIDYGAGFADFIAAFAPAATLPYLADVARIERAWLEAYHAAEAQSLAAHDIADITGEMAVDLVFQLHPSLRVVASPYPALTIWRLNVTARASSECDLDDGAEAALIVRPEADVEVRFLPPGGASFIQALGEGRSLAKAAARALEIEEFDLARNLKGLLEAGAFTTFTISEK